MTTQRTFRARRAKLAAFIRRLPPEKFTDTYECGTAHCALGWCPTVFPKAWEWDAGHPALRGTGLWGLHGGAAYFGVDWKRYFTVSAISNRTPKQWAAWFAHAEKKP